MPLPTPPNRPLLLTAGLCLALLSPLDGRSEQDMVASLDEDYLLGDMPVVLSASRLAQPVSESPAAMTIIDREIIEASGAIDIPDVLRLVPGFQVSHISGQNQTAQYHGIANQNPKRMQVLIDGRSVYHSAFGGVHWDSLPITLDDIDHIEVLRGSNAAAYGSNAFMGVVNIVTRHPSRDQGSQISLLTGYNGTREAEWRFGDRVGRLDYRFTLSGFETDGYPNHRHTHTYWDTTGAGVDPSTIVTGTDLQPESTTFTLPREDSQAIGRFNLRGDYLLENGDSLLFELGYVNNDRDNTLRNGSYELLRPDEKLRTSSQLLKWSRQSPGTGELSLQFSHNRLRLDSLHTDTLIDRANVDADPATDLVNAGPVLSGYKFQNDRYDLELQRILPESGGWRTVLGAGLRLDRIRGFNFTVDNRDVDRAQYRLFANTERHFGEDRQWVLNAGLMLEHQQDLGNYASPRVALNYHLNEYTTFRAAASRAYRMPSMAEQYNESNLYLLDPSSINPLITKPLFYRLSSNRGRDIDPERLDTLELGLVNSGWIEGLSFDVRIFREELRDYIDSVLNIDACGASCDQANSVPGYSPHNLWVYENAGWMDIKGGELQLRYNASDRTTWIASLSRVIARGFRNRGRDASGNLITNDPKYDPQPIGDFVPEITISSLLSHHFDHGISASIAYYRMGQMNWPNDGDRLQPYDRIDLRVAKKLRFAGHDAQIELIAQNAHDHGYIEFRSDNRFERRLYLRVKMDMD